MNQIHVEYLSTPVVLLSGLILMQVYLLSYYLYDSAPLFDMRLMIYDLHLLSQLYCCFCLNCQFFGCIVPFICITFKFCVSYYLCLEIHYKLIINLCTRFAGIFPLCVLIKKQLMWWMLGTIVMDPSFTIPALYAVFALQTVS